MVKTRNFERGTHTKLWIMHDQKLSQIKAKSDLKLVEENTSECLKSKLETQGSKSSKITKAKDAKDEVKKEVVRTATRSSTRLTALKFGDLSNSDLESKLSWEILSNFDLDLQLRMRTISPAWDYNVQLACKQIYSLILRIDKRSTTQSSYGDYYRTIELEQKYKQFEEAHFRIIEKQQKNPSTLESMRKLFANVKQLTIYYTMNGDNKHEFLFKLMQSFPKVESFSLIVPSYPNDPKKFDQKFTNKIFDAINAHLAPLNSLYIYFDTVDDHTPKIDPLILCKTLSYLQNFSLCTPIENPHKLLEMMGTSLPPHFPIQSLALRVPNLKIDKISKTFTKNPQLGKIRRLQLVDVNGREAVDSLLDHFTQLDYLQLWFGEDLKNKNNYSLDWMQTFAKLPNLTELVLHGMHPRALDFNIYLTTLPNIRRLTFSFGSFFANLHKDWTVDNAQPIHYITNQKIIFKEFVFRFARQYPNLQELTILTDAEKYPYNYSKSNFKDACVEGFRYLKDVQFENLADLKD